jgi:hypothetical protein
MEITKEETFSMLNLASVPDFDEVTAFIKQRVDAMHTPIRQWADLARLAVQGLPYDACRLAELEAYINAVRGELRGVVLAASEHFTEEKLNVLRKNVGMSKYAWRSVQKKQAVTLKNGFALVIY